MNKLRRTGVVVALILTLAVSAFGGIIHSTGAVAPPPPPPDEQASPANNESAQTNAFDAYQSEDATSSITTTVILTILSLVR